MNVLMIAAAPETDYEYVKPLAQRADYIICADGGVRHAQACGIQPDLVVGDFDSGSCPDFDVEVIRLKPEKMTRICSAARAKRCGAAQIPLRMCAHPAAELTTFFPICLSWSFCMNMDAAVYLWTAETV